MLLRDSTGRSVEFHLFASSGVDFAEDWLNAGALSRDADGALWLPPVLALCSFGGACARRLAA